MRMSLTSCSKIALLGAALSFITACDRVTDPPLTVEGALTADASTNWAYVSLADSAVITPTPSARESGAWDMAFFTTSVTVNGGEAGPGGVSAACVCQNADATDTEILAMTPESELADFESVTSVPAGITFETDVLTPAMSGWYTGSGAGAAAAPDVAFLVRLSNGTSFAKVHVTGMTGASVAGPAQVTLEYAVQTTSADAFQATNTITLSAAAPAVDLDAGAATSVASDWDLRLDGWNILVNGGITGSGSAAVANTNDDFATITTASIAPQAYRTDTYAGVFGKSKWYKYNLAGDNHISPTFNVYLLKRGTAVYKVQLIDYYSPTGAPRHISIRYRQIAQ